MSQQQSSQSLAGADRIRALKDDDAIFTAFDTYPWTKDKNFMVNKPSFFLFQGLLRFH